MNVAAATKKNIDPQLSPLPRNMPSKVKDLGMPTLEGLPADAMNNLLSFLTYSDYRRLSGLSTKLRQAVTEASHLYMEEPPPVESREITSSSAHSQQQAISVPIRLDQDKLTRLLDRFRSLDVLQLDNLAAVGDDLFKIMNQAPCVKTLTSLSLHGVSLTYWCTDCLDVPNLRILKLQGGSIRTSLGKIFSKSENIEDLCISQCSSLRDEQVGDLVKPLDASLTSLSLHQCLRIRTPTLQFSNMNTLSLMGCFALTDLPNFACPTLKHLDLSFCFRLPTSVIQKTVESLPALEELTLIKCTSLNEFKLESETIRTINLNFCDKLQTLRLKCPQLTRLDNVACLSLEAFFLDDARLLRELNLSTLPLSRVEIFASELRKLNVSGCKKLDRCTIHAPMLEKVLYQGSRMVALRFCKEVRGVIMKNWTKGPLEVYR